MADGQANNATIGFKGSQYISSGGVASGTVVSNGGFQIISADGLASDTALSKGSQRVFGEARDTHIFSGGSQVVLQGGLAKGTTIEEYGLQTVEVGGSAVGVVQSTYALLNATVTGPDDGTYISGINVNGQTVFLESGVGSGFVVNGGGFLNVSSGGSAVDVVQSASGNVNVLVQEGDGTYVSGRNEAGDSFWVQDGVAQNFIVNSGGSQTIMNGGAAYDTIIKGGTMDISSGGTVYDTAISRGLVNVEYGGVASNVELASSLAASLTVASGGQALNVVQSGGRINVTVTGGDSTTKVTGTNQNGSFYISNGVASNVSAFSMTLAGGSAENTVILMSGRQFLSSGAQANNTLLASEGIQLISSGAVASGTVPSGRYSSQIVYSGGMALDTNFIEGATYIYAGGYASGLLSEKGAGTVAVSAGGSADNIMVGQVSVLSGGAANSVIVNNLRGLSFSAGGSALNIVQQEGAKISAEVDAGTLMSGTHESGSFSLSGGVANSTLVRASARQTVFDGGVANYAQISGSSSYQNVSSGGMANSTSLLWSGTQNIYSGGSTRGTIISGGGLQNIYSGAYAQSTQLLSGGTQYIASGGAVNVSSGATSYEMQQLAGGIINADVDGTDMVTVLSGTNQFGSDFSLQSGVASNMVINTSAVQNVISGGKTYNTIVNGGTQNVLQTGSDTGAVLMSGVQNVTGTAVSATLIGGTQNVSAGGMVTSALLNGGTQNVYSGGGATLVGINSGTQNVYAGGSANVVNMTGGVQNVYAGAKATGVQVAGTGVQNVLSGANVTNVTVSADGTQNVSGTATSTTVTNGTQNIFSGGLAVDTDITNGQLNMQDSGQLNGLTAKNTLINVYANNKMQGNVSISDGSVVNFANMAAGNQLVVDNLSANNAVFQMNVDLEEQTADTLYIANSYDGQAVLSLTNVASSAQLIKEDGIKLVDFNDNASVNGTFELLGGQWDEGGFVYKLGQGTGSDRDYYLRNTGNLTDSFKTMLNVPLMNVMIARTGMNALQTRLGDLHQMNNTEKKQGIWVRSYYKDMTVKELLETDMQLFGAEAGYDWLFRADEPTKLYAGVMLGYIQADNIKTEQSDGSYNNGDGTAPTVGIYATLANENGWFVDIAARNFWTKLDMKARTSSGKDLAFEPDRNVFTASVETGKNFIAPARSNRFWRIEPKVELNYMNASADQAEVTSGIGDLKYDAANYLNAKAAVLLAYNARRSNGLLIEPLIELAYRYEFMGTGDVSYSEAAHETDLKGGILEANVALNMQLTDNLYWYVLGSYEAGDKIEGWGANLGFRYAFGGSDKSSSGAKSVKKNQSKTDKKAKKSKTKKVKVQKTKDKNTINPYRKKKVSASPQQEQPISQKAPNKPRSLVEEIESSIISDR